jgi:predicted transcriptional regulator of viral defense system
MISGAQGSLTLEQLRSVGAGQLFRARDVQSLGGGFHDLQRWLEQGVVEQVARGLYRLTASEPSEHYLLAAVAARAPNGILCLLSALGFYGIGTSLPADVWLAIPHKARPPRLPQVPLQVVRFSGPSLRYGVVGVEIDGVPARITSPARTVVDCFRFRRLVGTDVALEALRETLAEGKATQAEIWRAAETCRAASLLRPLLGVPV